MTLVTMEVVVGVEGWGVAGLVVLCLGGLRVGMGQSLTVDASRDGHGLSVVDVVRCSVKDVGSGDWDWDGIVQQCDGLDFEKEVKELMGLMEMYRVRRGDFDRERMFLTNLARVWSGEARKAACGEGSGRKCASLGRSMTVVLAAALHSGLEEEEVLYLFGKTEEGRDASRESQELLGKAVLHNSTSAAVDVIVSCADPGATFTAVEFALVLCSGQMFLNRFFTLVIDRHPRREQMLARLITLASSAIRRKARSEAESKAEEGSTKVRSALEMLTILTPSTSSTLSGPVHNHSAVRDPSELAVSLLTVLCAADWDGPHRLSLNEMNNSSRKAQVGDGHGLSFPFRTLFDSLASWLSDDRGAVLCYTLLSGNRRFRRFALARTDPETLVLPLLRLATGSVRGGDLRSTALAMNILLLLTESDAFLEGVGGVIVSQKDLATLDDSALGRTDATLAECMMACSLSILRYVSVRPHAEGLFTSGIAVAANVAPQLAEVRHGISERMVKVYELMMKRLGILCADADTDVSIRSTCVDHVALILELMEVLVRLTWSKDLLYTMLHQRALFRVRHLSKVNVDSRAHYTAVATRISAVILELTQALNPAGAKSVEQIFSVIESQMKIVSSPHLDDLPKLQFQFEPIKDQTEFFHAFSWAAATRCLNNEWDLSRSRLYVVPRT